MKANDRRLPELTATSQIGSSEPDPITTQVNEARLIGTRIDRYKIIRRLGAGAMGAVYAARDPELGRIVAIKLLHRQTATSKIGRESFRREAQAMARLSHPAVVPVFDVGEDGDRRFVAMELVEGQTLTRWLAERRPTWRAALAALTTAGGGLAAAHAAGIVHRDFKPDNVLVGHDGRVRVSDFGLARMVRGDDEDDLSRDGSRPTTGLVEHRDDRETALSGSPDCLGTPAYMAPEQHFGRRADALSDQFSFCVVLYEALYREPPFRRDGEDGVPSILALAAEVTAGRVQPAPRHPRVPAWLRRIVLRGLAVDPERRWPSMDALLEALRREPRRRRRVALSVGAALVAAGALALFHGLRAPASPADRRHEVAAGHQRGLELWRGGSLPAARRAWSRALASDPGLSPAALRLGLVSTPSAEGRRWLAEALAHRDRLDAADRDLLAASLPALDPVPDLAAWEAALERLSSRPGGHEASYFLGKVRQLRGDADGALAALAQAERDPALATAAAALRGGIERGRYHMPAAGRAYDDCLARSPDATECLAGRLRILALAGDCAGMERIAHRWMAIDPQDPMAADALAAALAARGAPLEAVQEALDAKWERARVSGGDEPDTRWLDRYRMLLLAGDIGGAADEADRARRAVPASSGLLAHYQPSIWVALAAAEAEDRARAAEVSMSFVRRARAWLPDDPRQVGAPLVFLGIAYRAGGIDAEERRAERARWLELFDGAVRRSGHAVDPYTRTFPWIVGYAAATTDAESAREAIEVLPRYEPLPEPGARESDVDLVIGQVFAQGGQPERARPYLERAAHACLLLENPLATLYAKVRLGELLLAAGEIDRGRAELEVVLRYWGQARPRSRFADRARRALASVDAAGGSSR